MLSGLSISSDFTEVHGEFNLLNGEGCSGHNAVTDEALKYWKKISDSNHLPRRSDIDLKALQTLLPRFTIIDYEFDHSPFKLKFRLMGTYVADHYGECTGGYVTEMKNMAAYRRVMLIGERMLNKPQPYMTITPGFDETRQYLKSYVLYLPLFDENGKLAKLWTCLDVAFQ